MQRSMGHTESALCPLLPCPTVLNRDGYHLRKITCHDEEGLHLEALVVRPQAFGVVVFLNVHHFFRGGNRVNLHVVVAPSQQLREVLSRSFGVVYGPLSEVCKDTEGALKAARFVVCPRAFQRGRILAAETTVIHPWAVLDYVKHH